MEAGVVLAHLFFKCGKGMLLIFNPEKSLVDEGVVPMHGSTGPGHVAFAINSDELPKWKEHLQGNNVEIEKEVNWAKISTHSTFVILEITALN